MIFGEIRGLFLVILVYHTAVIFVSDCAFLLSSTFQANMIILLRRKYENESNSRFQKVDVWRQMPDFSQRPHSSWVWMITFSQLLHINPTPAGRCRGNPPNLHRMNETFTSVSSSCFPVSIPPRLVPIRSQTKAAKGQKIQTIRTWSPEEKKPPGYPVQGGCYI